MATAVCALQCSPQQGNPPAECTKFMALPILVINAQAAHRDHGTVHRSTTYNKANASAELVMDERDAANFIHVESAIHALNITNRLHTVFRARCTGKYILYSIVLGQVASLTATSKRPPWKPTTSPIMGLQITAPLATVPSNGALPPHLPPQMAPPAMTRTP